MTKKCTTIRISPELRSYLGNLKTNDRETYEMLLWRKLKKKKLKRFVSTSNQFNNIVNSPAGHQFKKDLGL